jgi:hypothetical protein
MLSALPAFLPTLFSVFPFARGSPSGDPALRYQIGVLRRSARKRPKWTVADRVFWVWLSGVWAGWRSVLVIVKPQTVIAWHGKGLRFVLDLEGRARTNRRPPVSREVRDLIRTMSRANPLWGAPRIHGELLKLDNDIGETSVTSTWSAIGDRPAKLGARSWIIKSNNLSPSFFTVPTIRFQVL